MAKILLTVGGTGGHIFPALALAEGLRDEKGFDILFAGGGLSKNPYFEQNFFAYQDIACGKLSKNPLEWMKIGIGVIQGLKLIKKFDPDLVLGFGSYYTVPLIAAAKVLQRPLFLHESNCVPGRVNRYFSPFAEMTFVHFPSAIEHLKGPSEVAKMPLRPRFKKGAISQESARLKWGLKADLPTLLAFGGSQGAESINALFTKATCTHLKNKFSFQVIHFTGKDSQTIAETYQQAGILAYVRPFEKRMDIAWAAADLAVTRSGAVSLAEQVEYEVPVIYIPFPHSTDDHQGKNAAYADLNGLGIKRQQANLSSATLASDIVRVFENKKYFYKNIQNYKEKFQRESLVDKIIKRVGHECKR